MTIAGLVVRIDDCEPMSAFDPKRTSLRFGRLRSMTEQNRTRWAKTEAHIFNQLRGHTAPVLTHASVSAPARCCVPGAEARPNPGAQAQPTSVSVPM